MIWRYGINIDDAKETNIDAYRNFNDFFSRELKDGIRPITGRYCSPADGTVSAAGIIKAGQIFQAKGINYKLEKLLASNDIEHLNNGSFITVYLSPKDYHRVHCPIDATLIAARYVPGKLFSVSQTNAERVTDLFADNERLIMEFDTQSGKMMVIMVGAMIVAAIQPVWRKQPYTAREINETTFETGVEYQQGDELGAFKMGSTAIIITENSITWLPKSNQVIQMGESLTL